MFVPTRNEERRKRYCIWPYTVIVRCYIFRVVEYIYIEKESVSNRIMVWVNEADSVHILERDSHISNAN